MDNARKKPLLQVQRLRRAISCIWVGLVAFSVLLAGCTDGPITDMRGQVVERGGVSSGPQAVIEGGKPGKGIELGSVQGAGGPATAPEGPAGGGSGPRGGAAGEALPLEPKAPTFDLAKTMGEIQEQAQKTLPLQASGSYQPLPTGRIPVAMLPAAVEVEALVARLNDGSKGPQVSRFGKLELVDPQGLTLDQKPVEGPAGSTRWEPQGLDLGVYNPTWVTP